MRIETFALNSAPSPIPFFGNKIDTGVLLGKLKSGEIRPFLPYPDILEPIDPGGIRLEKGLHQDFETIPFFPLGLGMLTDLFKDGMEGSHRPIDSFVRVNEEVAVRHPLLLVLALYAALLGSKHMSSGPPGRHFDLRYHSDFWLH